MKNFKVEANEMLQRNELKSVFGGAEEEYDCSCNGHHTGTATSQAGCAALCVQCVNNGGCAE